MTGDVPDGRARNVLLIVADEWNHRFLGAAGHPLATTPHLDALAARGTRFETAWTPSPICVPARASLATGRRVHELGTWDSAAPYDGSVRGWAHVARDAGAHAVSIGKLHFRSSEDDVGFTDAELAMHVPGGIGWVQALDRRTVLPYPDAAELAADVGVGATTYTRYDDRIADRAEAWLETHGGGDRPWALQVGFVAPHYPLAAPAADVAPFLDDPTVADLEIEPTPLDHPAVADLAASLDYHTHFDDDLVRRGRAAYLALVARFDRHVGRLLDALDRSGGASETLVIVTSDHGEMAGNRGLWCKSFLYRDSVRIPMIVAGPGVATGAECTTPVDLLDVAPTITAVLAPEAEPLGGPGRSLVELADGADPDRSIFSEYHDGGSTCGSFALRSDRWTHVHHVGHRPQLFDHVADPDELVDLGTEPELAGVRADLDAQLRSIVDPEATNERIFGDQLERLAALGDRAFLRFNHTPVPTGE